MIQEWLSGNDPILGFDKDSSAIKDMSKKVVKVPLYDNEEVGLFHPNNSSIVKIRENGTIDIFTATNQGIRIDPNTMTLNIITDNELHHTTRHHEWIDGYAQFETHGEFNVISDSNINFTTKKNWTVNVDGDANITTKGDMNLEAGGKMNIRSKGNMKFDAPRYDYD